MPSTSIITVERDSADSVCDVSFRRSSALFSPRLRSTCGGVFFSQFSRHTTPPSRSPRVMDSSSSYRFLLHLQFHAPPPPPTAAATPSPTASTGGITGRSARHRSGPPRGPTVPPTEIRARPKYRPSMFDITHGTGGLYIPSYPNGTR